MADVKFSELSTLTTTASADVLAIVDSSESASKQLSIDNLFGAVPVNLAVTDLTQSTSTSTGSITTDGGMGVAKDAFFAANIYVRDSGLGLSSPTDGTLDLFADTILEITFIVGAVISKIVSAARSKVPSAGELNDKPVSRK